MIKKLRLAEGRTIVVYDPIPKPAEDVDKYAVEGLEPGRYVVFPASWAPDEPVEFIVREFLLSKASEDYKLVVTNDFSKEFEVI